MKTVVLTTFRLLSLKYGPNPHHRPLKQVSQTSISGDTARTTIHDNYDIVMQAIPQVTNATNLAVIFSPLLFSCDKSFDDISDTVEFVPPYENAELRHTHHKPVRPDQ